MLALSVVPCPVCNELIEIETPAVGREVECPECGEIFVVARTEPVELVYAYDLDEEKEVYDEERPRT